MLRLLSWWCIRSKYETQIPIGLTYPYRGKIETDLGNIFRGYSQIASTIVSKSEQAKCERLNDAALRAALVTIIQGADVAVLQREASKPHTGAEISNMEVPVRLNGKTYFLCVVVKSGREIKAMAVPHDVFAQVTKPFDYFAKPLVVLVFAKKCSEPLMNRIKVAREEKRLPIAVIEGRQLAALLSINGAL